MGVVKLLQVLDARHFRREAEFQSDRCNRELLGDWLQVDEVLLFLLIVGSRDCRGRSPLLPVLAGDDRG